MCGLGFWNTLYVSMLMIWGAYAHFPDLSWSPKYHQLNTLSSTFQWAFQDLLRPNWMQKFELNVNFFYISLLMIWDTGVSISWRCNPMLKLVLGVSMISLDTKLRAEDHGLRYACPSALFSGLGLFFSFILILQVA